MAGRAIELLCATTPQAKGRVERANRTLQDRLVRELRIRGISSIDEANAYLPAYMADHNERFSVQPRCDDDLHRSLEGIDLERSLCCRYDRIVSAERTFQIGQIVYAVDDEHLRPKSKISVREQQDRTFEIVYRDRLIPYHKLRALTQGAIVDSKAIRGPFNPRVPNPKKGHKPKPGHPWKSKPFVPAT